MSKQNMSCPKCGALMNYHADKLDYTTVMTKPDLELNLGGIFVEVHTCPSCKNVELQTAT